MSEPLIVVPLDGSELSEGALPVAKGLASKTGAGLLLVTVWDGVERDLSDAIPALAKELRDLGENYYQAYLGRAAKGCEADGVRVETQVRIGQPADEVLRVIAEREPQLLVLATHGRSGLGRWWYGSVAGRLLREAPVPTVSVGPKVLQAKAPFAVRRILAPLDGSPLGESALKPALQLAAQFEASVVLARVVQFGAQAFAFTVPETYLPQLEEAVAAGAQAYLDRVKESLAGERPTETKVLHGFAADALTDLVADEGIDLVVMASHGRSGLRRAALGSVADRMLQGPAPVLLVRPEAPAPASPAARGRYCHTCSRASPYVEVTPEDRCLRCGQHLRACGNCVYFDGVGCLVQRPELHDTYPGLNCPLFQFRETAPGETARPSSGGAGPAPA